MNVFKLASRMALLGAVAIAIVACDEPSGPFPTATPAAVVAVTPAPTSEPTSTPSPTPTATREPTSTPSPTPTSTATPEPTSTPSPTPTAPPEPTSTPSPSPTPEPVAHPSDILDWFADPPDNKHSFAAKSIERMWDLYPDIGVEVARLNWVGDGITWNEEFVLEELSYVVSEDPELVRAFVNQEHRSYLLEVGSGSAERAADYPWLTDDVNALELWTIIGIARIAERNPGFAERVLGYTWLADGINEAEALGLGALSRWALLAPELVDRVLKYSWLDDGITDAEGGVLSVLHAFAERGGVEAAKQVMDYQCWPTG